MEKFVKETYLAPETEEMVVKTEGIVCASIDGDPSYNGFGLEEGM